MIHIISFFRFLEMVKNKYHLNLKIMIRFIEVFAIILALPMSLTIKSIGLNGISFQNPAFVQYFVYFSLFALFWFALLRLTTMAILPKGQRYLHVFLVNFKGYLLLFLSLALLSFLLSLSSVSTLFIFVHISECFFISLSLRVLTILFFRTTHINGYNLRNIIIIGDSESFPLIDKLQHEIGWGYQIRAIISQSRFIKRRYEHEIPIITASEYVSYILESQVVDEILYSKKKIILSELRSISKIANEIGVVLRVQRNDINEKSDNIELKTINSIGKLSLINVPSHKLDLDIKSFIDVVFSSLAVAILSPFILIIAILIKISSKGPVFFAQERVGLRGRKFKLYKFRTMVVDAEKMIEKLIDHNEMDGPTFKMKNDPRVTPIGRILRKSGIDELPQLFNVIKGQMSLIGPRPPLESEVREYERWQLRRLSVKPGITCTWQIMPNRNDIKFDKWMRMDLDYIDQWSISKDIGIIFKTISAIVLATGR